MFPMFEILPAFRPVDKCVQNKNDSFISPMAEQTMKHMCNQRHTIQQTSMDTLWQCVYGSVLFTFYVPC